MELLIAFTTMITITLLAYGVLYRPIADDSVGSRIAGLRYKKPGREELPDPDAAFKTRVLGPLAAAFSRRTNSILPSSMQDKLEQQLTRAGTKMTVGQFAIFWGISAGVVPLVMLLLMSTMYGGRNLLMIYGFVQVLGIMYPRLWLNGKVKKRQKLIWRSLPDAFDLITASVEAGLGVDAAFTRVIDKVSGPFADELTKTMREIQMGRSRRDALVDMADRTGVDELRSLVNSIVQAESMGISIGTVIRVQTGVIRTKRKQKAEEAAFKAPIKMVFPLVLFIFPCIMIVIGGPAVIKIMGTF